MQLLLSSELKSIEGGFPWLVVAGVGILIAGMIDGCNDARYETTAQDPCPEENKEPEC